MGDSEPATSGFQFYKRVLYNIKIQQQEMACCFVSLGFLFDGDFIITLLGKLGKFLPLPSDLVTLSPGRIATLFNKSFHFLGTVKKLYHVSN